jgi:hypothetical protein
MPLKKNIAISDSGFIFDPLTGNSFSTNPIGLDIIEQLKQNKSVAEIKSNLLEHYDALSIAIEKDLDDFLQQLAKHKLTNPDEKN